MIVLQNTSKGDFGPPIHVRTQEEATIGEPQNGSPQVMELADISILNFQPLVLWTVFVLF